MCQGLHVGFIARSEYKAPKNGFAKYLNKVLFKHCVVLCGTSNINGMY